MSDTEDILSDEEPITAQKVLENLENAWLNEKFAPEILPHQAEMIDLMLDQIAHIEENVRKLDKNDFRVIAHRMELERIRYVIASYLRCRLEKIEQFTLCIMKEEERRSEENKRLSEEETKFCREYYENIEKHFHQLALRHMPPNLQSDEKNQRIVRPNLMSHIFFKAKETSNICFCLKLILNNL